MKPSTNHLKMFRAAVLAGVIASLMSAPAMWAAVVIPDTVTVATVNGPQFSTVDVPVYIRDASGTPLGLDQPPGSRIQSYSIRVNYAPASAVQSITFTRAGITQSLTPTFENSPASAGAISLLDTFNEATDLIPFTLDGALPGNQIAHLQVTLAPTATPGTIITLTIDPTTTVTQLSDQAGSPGTVENTGNGRLVVVSGAITVVPSVPALGPIALMLLAIALGIVAIRIRS